MRIKVSTTFKMGSRNLVRLRGSDALAPARFTSRIEDGEAIYTLDVELSADGHSRCIRLEVEPVGDDVPVPTAIDVPRLLRVATADAAGVATYQGRSNGVTRISAATDAEADAAWSSQVGQRPKRREGAPDYKRVAEVWRESGGKIEAIHDAFGPISAAGAYRYVKKARDLGFLPAADTRRAA